MLNLSIHDTRTCVLSTRCLRSCSTRSITVITVRVHVWLAVFRMVDDRVLKTSRGFELIHVFRDTIFAPSAGQHTLPSLMNRAWLFIHDRASNGNRYSGKCQHRSRSWASPYPWFVECCLWEMRATRRAKDLRLQVLLYWIHSSSSIRVSRKKKKKKEKK